MKKFKFGIVDLVIIVAVILAIAAVVMFLNVKSDVTGQSATVSYTVELKQQPYEYMELVKKGDDIKDSIKGGYLGKVKDIRYKKATDVVENKIYGTFEMAEYDDKYDIYITIEGTPTSFGDNIMFASQEIKVGKMIYIKNKNYVGSGYIVEMDINE